MTVENIDLWISAVGFESPYYRFYTDSDGHQELTDLIFDTSKSYTFYRLNEESSHPFFISDIGYKQTSSDAILITGDGNPSNGIKDDQSFKVEFTQLVGDIKQLLYYCSSHQPMQGHIAVSGNSTLPPTPSTPNLSPGSDIGGTAEVEILVAKETLDQNNDGFIDDTNQTQILHEGVGLTMKSPKGIITGNRNDWKRGIKVLKAISTDNTYEVLVKSMGRDFSDTWSVHKFKIRTVDLTGTIVDPGIWRDKEYALAYGWEEKFGDIIKPDGVVVAKGFFDQNNDGLVDDTNQSLILHEGVGLTIKNPNGVTRGNKNDKKTGIKILKAISSDNGYEILVKGTGTDFSDTWSRYKFTQWTVDQTGTITDFGTWRDHEYALVYGWEEKFGDVIKRDGVIGTKGFLDLNNDGFRDDTNQTQILHEGVGLTMKSPKGIITGNRNDEKRGIKVLKAISTDNTYEVLVKSIGTDFSDTWSVHKFKIRTVDLTGTIVDPGIWRDEEYALAYGWEEKFGDIIKPDGVVVAKGFFDQNNDGLVDDTNQSLILHEGVGLTIKNPNGVTRGNSNDKKTGIKILKAISSDNGYEILVKGTGTNFNDKWSRYKFTQWTVDQTGTITDFGTWRDHEYALVYGWEEKFGDVIKRDGVITPPPRNTFFVSLDGDDNNPGTLEAPFRTIKMGLQRIGQTRDVPGGTLTIRGGTYRLPIGRYKWGEYNQEDTTIDIIGLHGDKDDPIRIQNYQDEEVIISGAKKIKPRWEKHEGNIWKTEVKYLPSQLFLDGKMLTGARWPNITKNWDQLDDSNANNPTPGSYWHPDTWANSASKLPAVDLKGAVVVPIDTEGAPGNIIKVIKKKPAEATDMILEDREYGITWNDPIEDWNARPDDGEKCNSCIPSTYYLTNHLNLLDQPGEWHLEQRHSSKKVETSYGTDYVLKREPSVLYVWMPDGSDPNQRNIEARAFSNVPLLSQENNLLNINKSSNIIFDGITFHTGEINLNGAKNITFDNSKFLYSGHHAHMIADTESGEHNLYGHGGYVNLQTNNMGYAGDEGERIGLGFEKERNITISNSEIAYTFGGAFLTWGKGVSGNTIDNVYFHNKVGGDNAFEFGRDSANNKVRRLEYHTFGWGGVGRIGNQIWRTQEYGGNDYPTSVIELSRVYNPFWHGDDAGFQINQGQVYNLVVRQNWLHDLPGRNGIRFDGDPAGFGGTAHHNVSFNNRRGFRLKGDHHTVLNNVAFHNDRQDVRVTEDRFYGWRPGKGSGYNDAGCSPTDRMLRNGDWYCTKYPSDYVKQELVPELLSNANSIIHNNAGDKDSGMTVHSPADSTNNSMGKEARNGSYMRDELRDVYNFDFRPKAGSSLIDQGKHIPGYTDGYIGSAPDIGAYEYGDENYWIPGYQTKKAKTPIPQNGAYNAKLDTDLMWLEGRNSISNDIYFGSDPSDLQFQGNQTNNIFTPKEPLTAGQTYYWRIDTVTDQETIPGDVWMFAPDNPEKPDAPGVPIFSSAATSTDGTKVLLTYSETLSATTAESSAFSVTTDGSDNPITAVAIF
ncbi:hypothetical protein OAZ88_01020, partial [bacterium]|nr:hypothetical protein [bacterium]